MANVRIQDNTYYHLEEKLGINFKMNNKKLLSSVMLFAMFASNITVYGADALIPGANSLSGAINDANTRIDGRYHIEVSGDMTEGNLPKITGNVDISGLSNPIIDLEHKKGFQFIDSAKSSTMSNLTLTNVGEDMPAIYNEQNLGLENITFDHDNNISGSGALYNQEGTVNITGTTSFSSNSTTGNSGAIYNHGGTINIISSDKSVTFTENSSKNGGSIVNAHGSTMNIEDTQFSGNKATEIGGAILSNNSVLNISQSTFENNQAYWGGAIDIDSGSTTLGKGNIFSNNKAELHGGAINNSFGSKLTVEENTFTSNNCHQDGGAITNFQAEAKINNSAFKGNQAGDDGGAVYTFESDTTISNSSFDGNAAGIHGGAIVSHNGTTTVSSSSIKNNTANSSGGAIYNYHAQMSLENTSLESNSAYNNGGALYNDGTTVIKQGTVVSANNTGVSGGAIYNKAQLDLSANGGDIKFSNNTDAVGLNDIHNTELGTININGDSNVIIGGGFSGKGQINKTNTGTLILSQSGDSSRFTGNFHQTEGTTNVDGGFFGGTSTIDGGTVNWMTSATKPESTGVINVNGGNLNIGAESNSAVLNLNNPLDTIEGAAVVNLHSNSAISNQGTVTLDSGDNWEGHFDNAGTLILDGFQNNKLGTLNQSSGDFKLQNGTDFILGDNSSISGGNVHINSGSTLHLGDSAFFTQGTPPMLMTASVTGADNLFMNNGTVNSMNSSVTSSVVNNQLVVGSEGANFKVDIDPVTKTADKFTFNGGIAAENGPANINLSDFYMLGGKTSVNKSFDVQVFEASAIDDDIVFTAPGKQITTPIGKYGLTSYNNGWYGINWQGFNPTVYAGQVASGATYYHQLVIDNLLFDHVYLDSQSLVAKLKNSNKYAAIIPQFAPYQYKRDGGSLWFKPYTSIEKLALTQGLNPNNTIYGGIVGADFDAIELRDGWKFLPTAYISYNGGRQSFDNVTMYQNGGQGGLMGTWMRGEFIGSLLAFGGGFLNEMSINGFDDNFGNWIAGTAGKVSYNFHPREDWIIQPTLMMAYTAIGKQNWTSSFGNLPMSVGYFNGIGLSPGLNIIYGREDWTVYLAVQYMYNINDKVSGTVDGVDLPWVRMRHGYIDYGIGGTKAFQDNWMAYAQVTARNGGRTGIAFQGGLSYKW